MRYIRGLIAAGVSVLCSTSVEGQTPFRHSDGDTKHSTYSPLPNEHIDPASGALTIVATDLVLRGNAGFDLRVTRVYNSSLYPNYDSGYLYTFGHQANLGGTLGTVRYVTEIRDPFNNKIEFSYFASPGPVDGVSQIRQYLSSTQIRTVNFTYDSARNSLATMSYGSRTWTYVQDAYGSSGHSRLREVRPPVGPAEEYDYAALPGELTRIETPGGGIVVYTYADAIRKASTLTQRTRVVTTRTSSGRLVTGGTWTFDYGTGPNEDTTVISCACDGGTAYPTRTAYRFHGTGLLAPSARGKRGRSPKSRSCRAMGYRWNARSSRGSDRNPSRRTAFRASRGSGPTLMSTRPCFRA